MVSCQGDEPAPEDEEDYQEEPDEEDDDDDDDDDEEGDEGEEVRARQSDWRGTHTEELLEGRLGVGRHAGIVAVLRALFSPCDLDSVGLFDESMFGPL